MNAPLPQGRYFVDLTLGGALSVSLSSAMICSVEKERLVAATPS
jgi:hypothetical protein